MEPKVTSATLTPFNAGTAEGSDVYRRQFLKSITTLKE